MKSDELRLLAEALMKPQCPMDASRAAAEILLVLAEELK